jgi:predicted porin
MQKKLLTIAVAGAFAAPGAALAQVEVYGFISVAVNKYKYSSTPTTPSVSKWDVSSHGSNYGVRGRENIGGGNTAWFQIEQNAPMERSNNVAITPASRNTAVGIQGGWGNFFIGQWTTPWADLESLWSIGSVGGYSPSLSIIGRRETTGTAPNPNCVNGHLSGGAAPVTSATSVAGVTTLTTTPVCDAVEAAGGAGHPFWRRISQSVFYYSPVFSGAQVKLAYQTNEGKSTTSSATATIADPSMWSAALQWSGMGGRARVGVAFDSHKDFTTIGKTDSGWTIKGGYNFGFVDVGLAYEEMTYKNATNDTEATQYGIAFAVPVGGGAIRASYSVAEDTETGGTKTDNGAKETTIGYDYRFSKRTQVGFGYAVIKNDPGAVFTWTGSPPNQTGSSNIPSAGSDPSTFFVSVIHRF